MVLLLYPQSAFTTFFVSLRGEDKLETKVDAYQLTLCLANPSHADMNLVISVRQHIQHRSFDRGLFLDVSPFFLQIFSMITREALKT